MIPYPKEFEQVIFDVFQPKQNEKIGIFFDVPNKEISDNPLWIDRRKLAEDWFEFFNGLSDKVGFSVELGSFDSTGSHNKMLTDAVLFDLGRFNLILALTEFSITSSLASLISSYPDSLRCASMPGAERRMHDSVYLTNYKEISRYAHGIRDMLEKAISAQVVFSTCDELVFDLRNRSAGADDGDCTRPGSLINFPSGEGFISPYEGLSCEADLFGSSKTKGTLPFMFHDELIRGTVNQNRITHFSGPSQIISFLEPFFDEGLCRRNIAELGIGCNPKALVTGNMFEDEKAGVHIAYGASTHLGGKVSCDTHLDLIFAKNCPIVADLVILYFEHGPPVDIVCEGELNYEFFSI